MLDTQETELYLWDDESGEPCPMTIEEVDARLEAFNDRMELEDPELDARNAEIEARVTALEAELKRILRRVEKLRP